MTDRATVQLLLLFELPYRNATQEKGFINILFASEVSSLLLVPILMLLNCHPECLIDDLDIKKAEFC